MAVRVRLTRGEGRGESIGEGDRHGRGHEVVDGATVGGDLPDEPARHEPDVGPARQEHGPHAGGGVVHVRHLLLDVEVDRVAQALDDEVGAGVGGRLHRQPVELLDLDGRQVGEAGGGELDALVGSEQSGRLLVVVQHADHDVAEQLHRLVDDVDVAEVERIEAAGDQHRCHGVTNGNARSACYRSMRSKNVTQVRP